ncbi:MAG: hypothetical protein AAB403_13655 [Planctomycetota bacterium]
MRSTLFHAVRRIAELLSRGVVLRRRLPWEFGASRLFVTPEAGLKIGVVPRYVWPDKPRAGNMEYVMRQRLLMTGGGSNGTIVPGILGQYWEAAGWFGILSLSCCLGLGCHVFERIIHRRAIQSRFVVLIVVWGLFISFRALAASNFIPALICWVSLERGWLPQFRRGTPYPLRARVTPPGAAVPLSGSL